MENERSPCIVPKLKQEGRESPCSTSAENKHQLTQTFTTLGMPVKAPRGLTLGSQIGKFTNPESMKNED